MVNQTSGQTEYEFDWQNPDYVKPQYQVGRVISRTYLGVFKQWKPIGLAMLVYIVINILLTLLSYVVTGRTGLEADAADVALEPTNLMITFLSAIIGIFGIVFVMAVTDAALFSEYTKRPMTLKELVMKAMRKTIPLAFGIVLFLAAYYLGLVFFILPGLFVYLGWGIFGPVYVNEDEGLFASFGRSWNLMAGYKRWFFLSSFVIGLINLIIFMILFFIMMLPFFTIINDPSAVSGMGIGFLIFVGIGYTLGFMLYFVLTASMTTANYLEVKQLKEGAGHANLANVFA